jgi:putative redox protein
MKAPIQVDLVWEHDLVFGGRSGTASMTLDSGGHAGPSPVQTLAFALAACMGMDVVHIVRKGRHDLRGLAVSLVAERAQEDPHRLLAVTIQFTVTGSVPDAQVRRAIDLSHDKYCSVWHSLRQDIKLSTSFTVAPAT